MFMLQLKRNAALASFSATIKGVLEFTNYAMDTLNVVMDQMNFIVIQVCHFIFEQ